MVAQDRRAVGEGRDGEVDIQAAVQIGLVLAVQQPVSAAIMLQLQRGVLMFALRRGGFQL